MLAIVLLLNFSTAQEADVRKNIFSSTFEGNPFDEIPSSTAVAAESPSESIEVKFSSEFLDSKYSKNKFPENLVLITKEYLENDSLRDFLPGSSSTLNDDDFQLTTNSGFSRNFFEPPSTSDSMDFFNNEVASNEILSNQSKIDQITSDSTKTATEPSTVVTDTEVSTIGPESLTSTINSYFPNSDEASYATETSDTLNQQGTSTKIQESTIDTSSASIELISTVSSTSNPAPSTSEPASSFKEISENVESTTEASWESSSSETNTQPDLSVVIQERNDIIEMTLQYHQMRVKLASQCNTIANHEKTIAKLTQTVNDLRHDVTKLEATHRHEMHILNETNEVCQNDLKNSRAEIKVARHLFAMEKYSTGMRRKLAEFGIDEKTKM